jgi:hypothetical protein
MKGISTEMVVLILMVLIGIALLYFAWTGGFLPFGAGVSESDCYTKMLSACSGAQVSGDWAKIGGSGSVAQKCSLYFKGLNNCEKCASNPDDTVCQACCQQDLPKWTPKR